MIHNSYTEIQAKFERRRVFMEKNMEYISILSDLKKIQTGTELLLHGFLSPILVDINTLQNTITAINIQLETRHPGSKLLWTKASEYYTSNDYLFGRHGNHLLIQTHFPVTSFDTEIILFKITSFPVTLPGNEGHISEITNLPRYFIGHQNYPYYVIPETETVEKAGTAHILLQHEPLRAYSNAPTCVSALFKNDLEQIKHLCHFRLQLTAEKNSN